jgi:hypothetical protein
VPFLEPAALSLDSFEVTSSIKLDETCQHRLVR